MGRRKLITKKQWQQIGRASDRAAKERAKVKAEHQARMAKIDAIRASLTPEQRATVDARAAGKYKKEGSALVSALFGVSLLYVGRPGKWALFLVTGLGLGFGYVYEIFKATSRVKDYNRDVFMKAVHEHNESVR